MTGPKKWTCIVCGRQTNNVALVMVSGVTVYEYAVCPDTCARRVEVTAMGHDGGTSYVGRAVVALRVTKPC